MHVLRVAVNATERQLSLASDLPMVVGRAEAEGQVFEYEPSDEALEPVDLVWSKGEDGSSCPFF